MSITHLTSVSQLNKILEEGKLTVIDFHATWCGPCHAIAPAFETLSRQFKNVNFLKCDVDAAREVATLYRVSAMSDKRPTFVFLKGATKVDQVRGADKNALENALRRHAGSSSSTTAFSGRGQTLAGSNSPAHAGQNPRVRVWQLDPQMKVLLGLIGMYLLFWYLS